MATLTSASAAEAEAIVRDAGQIGSVYSVHRFFGLATHVPTAAEAPNSDDLNDLLNGVATAPGATTVVTVPADPISGDAALIQNVQILDSYIAVLTAIVMYKNHPDPYNLSDEQSAAQFVIDLANARNFIVTGGAVKAIPMYLPMGEASTQTINKSTTSADLHVELLTALFGALGLPANVLTELDGILTNVSETLKNLQLSFSTQSQTLNHFVSFYHLVPVTGANPPVNQMNVEFIYLQLDQSSWKASAGKSSVDHFTLNVSMTRTTATMSAGMVAANTSNIVNALMTLTSNDAQQIAEMTKMKGVKT